MRFKDLLEFKKDLYFEGAVQIDWFYDKVRSAKVAENFVFHGKDYFGTEETISLGKKRIDTISLVKELTNKLNDEAYPELLPESRAEINESVPAMCEENALYGYKQGVRNTLIGTGLAALAVGTGVTIIKLIDAKKKSKQPKKKD